jgi:DNA (cytosine-5)-methyltransferase 1
VADGGLRRVEKDDRWLWPEFARVIRALRPRFVVLENVAAILNRGMDLILSSLAEMGFAAEWGVLSACMFGAPHTRERLFLVAYPDSLDGQEGFRVFLDRSRPHEPGYALPHSHHWLEPFTGIPGVANGVPGRVDRLRTLGNAVVPEVAEWIGRLIMEASS